MSLDALAEHLAALPPVAVVYTDLDGTLLGPGGSLLTGPDGTPSARAAEALCAAADAGTLVVPVSGRRRSQLQHDARLLGLSSCIAEAGGVIVRDGQVHHEWGEAPRDLADTPHDAMEVAGAVDVLLETFPGDLRRYEPWHIGREASHIFHGLVDTEQADAALAEADLGWCRLLDNGASGGWPGRPVRAYHLLPRGVGKAQAVRDDLAHRGLTSDQAIAIGDSVEDRRIAEAVATYVQVSGGHGAPGPNVFTVPEAMGHGFALAVTAAVSAQG